MTGQAQLVSVIIPAFNAAQWIRESISSVIAQTYSHLEIIIVDDGSTDDTAAVIAEFTDPRIHVVCQPQRGAAAARNAGLAIARGHFVQFLDADDLLSAEKIERQVVALEQASAGSVASCEWVHLDDAGIRKAEQRTAWRVRDPIEWLVRSLRGGGMMQPAGWLTPRAVIDRAGSWNEKLTLHDDGDFFARVLAASDANVFVDDALAFYRDNPRGLSRQRSRQAAESAFAVCESRRSVIASRRHDRDAHAAIATQYAQFAYEFASLAPDLASRALERIAAFDAAPDAVFGTLHFRRFMRLAGFRPAMLMRRLSARIRH
ncbi:MAG TPA: glycosyltransferase [Gemmatimonadaceae bacterium]|nr:glycosyltransferase [Gemmatimonadaceae bacterium]